MGEVDQLEHPVDQGVAEGDQRVKETVGETSNEQAQKFWVKHIGGISSGRFSGGQTSNGDRDVTQSAVPVARSLVLLMGQS